MLLQRMFRSADKYFSLGKEVPLLLYFSEKPYPIFTPISTPIHHFYHDKKTNRQISQDKQYTAVFSAKISLFLSLLTNHDNACQNAVHNKKCTAEALPEIPYTVYLESPSYSGLVILLLLGNWEESSLKVRSLGHCLCA